MSHSCEGFTLKARGPAALCLAFSAGVAYGPIHAQTTPAAQPAFTVVSVKIHPDTGPTPLGIAPVRSGNRVRWERVPLPLVVLYAYRIPGVRLGGNLLHTFDEMYDIDAFADGSPSEDQVRLMFQTLLEDRFAIKVHWETKEMSLYRLLVARDGLKLKPAAEDSKIVIDGRTFPTGRAAIVAAIDGPDLVGKGAALEQLIDALTVALRQPVMDQTGLTGTFDFDVKFQREDDVANAAGGPFIAPAIQKALGLRLESGKGPVELLVVDHVGKLSEN